MLEAKDSSLARSLKSSNSDRAIISAALISMRGEGRASGEGISGIAYKS